MAAMVTRTILNLGLCVLCLSFVNLRQVQKSFLKKYRLPWLRFFVLFPPAVPRECRYSVLNQGTAARYKYIYKKFTIMSL